MEDAIEKVKKNTNYKVLTKEEYESLLAIAAHKDNKTSTPQVTQDKTTLQPAIPM